MNLVLVGSDTSFTLTTDLEDNSDYYWKVVATDLSGVTRVSEDGYSKFTVNTSNNPPNQFKLITPTPGSVEITQTPYFYWEESIDNDLRDTVSYELIILKDLISTNALSYKLDMNEFSLLASLDDNTIYSWCVIANDTQGALVYSDTSAFLVNTVLEPPLSFELLYPLNNMEELEDTIEFAWSEALDNDPYDYSNYKIYLSKDSSFVTIDFMAITDTTCKFLLEGQLEKGIKYFWFVEAIDTDSLITKSTVHSFVIGTPLSVESDMIVSDFVLEQNYPNPFNPSTMIKYGIPEQSKIKVEVFNTLGQSVGVLVNEEKSAGYYEVIWNATNLPSGIYLVSIKAEDLSSRTNFTQVKKALLLK